MKNEKKVTRFIFMMMNFMFQWWVKKKKKRRLKLEQEMSLNLKGCDLCIFMELTEKQKKKTIKHAT